MGKEQSKVMIPEVEGEKIEVTDSYVLHNGRTQDGVCCSIFSGAPSSPLQTLGNNLKTHRHPNILKYVSSGQHNGQYYVVTESVKPLFVLLETQSPLQICVGLHSILSALTFLHNQATTSHNNVCCASIFVTPEGVWKLGGLEFMSKFANTNSQSLLDLLPRRYEHSIAPEERNGRINPSVIDVYGLGVLITELFQKQTESGIAFLEEMLEFCKLRMMEADPRLRVPLSDVAGHAFFSHDFIRIHKFLVELPLRTAEEKSEFFRELEQQLATLPEEMIASQLLPLLLSRIVILENTAQQHFIPLLLRPKIGTEQNGALLPEHLFRKYVVPRLLQMFCVHDREVRLLLLQHLPGFLNSFTREQMQKQLLPEILVGVKDENDQLVAATLRALASLVGILGGAAVVGGKRGRLFSDGRPGAPKPRMTTALPERPSPDGGEDSIAEDTETWSDWDQPSEKPENEIAEPVTVLEIHDRLLPSGKRPSREFPPPTVTLADIDTLDIKSAAHWSSNAGPDFFSDMEPVISKTRMAPVLKEDKFRVDDAGTAGDAWDSFEDWGDDGVSDK